MLWDETLMDTTLCLFNRGKPGDNDPLKDCTNFAVWHIQYAIPDGSKLQTQACDEHFTFAMRHNGEVDSFHEFMSACNLPRSWFDRELGTCYTEERGLELGRLQIVEEAG